MKIGDQVGWRDETVDPFYADDLVTIIQGDCRQILRSIDPESFAALVTDPPYGIGYKSNGGGTTKDNAVGWWFGDAIEGDENTAPRDQVLAWWGDRPALVFGSWKAPRPAGTRAVLIYDKGGATGMGDLSIPWKPSHEEIYVIGRGFVGSRDSGSVLQGRVQAMAKNGRLHPTEKDVRTLAALIAKCPPGAILDPFMGSGSTLVAAKSLGRHVLGIEAVGRYCEIAAERVGGPVAQRDDNAFDFGGTR